ncbi:MAG: peroxiredoxin [Myxococcales bacterium]|nr:peroxiredoxin [Myxococcales bacterium]
MLARAALVPILLLLACSTPTRPDGQKGVLTPGMKAPELEAIDHRGERVRIPSGAPLLVFFYPKDNTPGCTREACALRDAWDAYQKKGVEVVGVSADSLASHREFAEEHGLPFGLVSDDGTWGKAFGVGRTLGMHRRTSFLIDGEGVVRKTYEDVDPGVHAEQVLADAEALGLTR